MKEIKKEIFMKIILLFFLSLILVFLTVVFLFIDCISGLIVLKLAIALFVILLSFVFFLRKIEKKFYEDIESIHTYLYEISKNKNYGAIIKIQHYIEFLQVSLLLKDVVKRLYKKDKKN